MDETMSMHDRNETLPYLWVAVSFALVVSISVRRDRRKIMYPRKWEREGQRTLSVSWAGDKVNHILKEA